ncbi:MAG: MFS transporter [Chloroflexi bacterium]|nr:MFS transporter [Chloroflexota bacterium]
MTIANDAVGSKWYETHNWRLLFFSIWTGQALSLLGSRLVQFGLVWWLTKETGSATVLATATLVAILPQVVLGPMVGALVDRWDRRRVMIAADSAIAAATLALALLFLADLAHVWHIYVILAVRSLGGAFHMPAMQASTSLMVPEQQLSRVNGMNQTLQGAVSIAGPPLGALLLELLPMQGLLSIDVVTAMIAVTPLLFIAIPQPTPQSGGGSQSPGVRPSVWADFRAGLRYVWSWPGLRIILIMAALINFLFIPAGALMPLLVKEYFDGDAYSLAVLEGLWGGGMLLGGLTLSVWGGFKQGTKTSMVGITGMGLGAIVVGLTPSNMFALAVAGMFLSGFMNPITNGPLFATLQKSVAPEMQGRVFTIVMALAGAMMPLSLIISGPVADLVGVQVWYILAGVGCITAGVIGLTTPAVINLEADMQAANVVEESSPAEEEVLPDLAGPLAEAVD